MILCGWIVLVLQVQNVFNCQPPANECCPDNDDCCDDASVSGPYYMRGVCCSETETECVCTTKRNSWYGVMLPFVKANWGNWGEWQHCPKGEYVVGMRVKAERYQGIELSMNVRKVLHCLKNASPGADISTISHNLNVCVSNVTSLLTLFKPVLHNIKSSKILNPNPTMPGETLILRFFPK